MSTFKSVKSNFRSLYHQYISETNELLPTITIAHKSDIRDYTSANEIRIKPVKNISDIYHAKHLFGHFLSDLHSANVRTNHTICDQVADLIAILLSNQVEV